ncbi:hypothetical protein [Salinibacterium sp. M195]|uniref:hypothetical protein n=1 Tax=Salinibacterium sp. M195 TaxID=2583374 RepID=UPI001C6354AE|nr:hypothetical protein [Salinibacterium sp. M195]QYH36365.1 hypothetical protein FFT87_10610 [Salinibacterium sp. M195]
MTLIGSKIHVPHFVGSVGLARRDITPPLGIRARNWGPAEWDRSEGTHLPMTLTALAFGSSTGHDHVSIAVDATWWRRVDDEWAFRGAVLEAVGLRPEQLTISLSHTHAGPVLCRADEDLPGGELIGAYLDTLAEAAIEAAREALANRQSGRIEWVEGGCSLAANRELVIDGRALVGFNPDEVADDTVLVGRVSDASGRIIGTIVNYACHPTTLTWQNRLISPDYIGEMREIVESDTGAPCVFLLGAAGELAPKEQYTGDTEVADRHGRSLGYSVLAALSSLPAVGSQLELTGLVESGAPLAMWETTAQGSHDALSSVRGAVELEFVDLPTIAELEFQWADIDEASRRERISRARNLRDGYVLGSTVQHPVWAWRVGDAVFVGHPGEAYSKLQIVLRERFPLNPIVVVNLTNGPGFVYLPTTDAYERGAYQAWQTPLKPGSLERLEAFSIQLVEELLEGAHE